MTVLQLAAALSLVSAVLAGGGLWHLRRLRRPSVVRIVVVLGVALVPVALAVCLILMRQIALAHAAT